MVIFRGICPKNRICCKNGFTIIELLVVITIIAILTSFGIVSYSSANKRSRDAKRKSDIEAIRQALEMYRADKSFYPSAGGGDWYNVGSLDFTSVLVSGYLPSMPDDPKTGLDYYYQAANLSGGDYYGYCLSASLESENPVDLPCTPNLSVTPPHNYGVKNP